MSATNATDVAIKLVEDSLAEKQAELEKQVGPLAAEIKDLEAFLKKARRGSGSSNGTPAVSDGDLLEAVAHVSKSGPALTTDIAKFMGVDSRKIAKKLSKHAGDGTISGNKDDGYSA